MAVGDIKIKWSKDKDGWWGTILPMFLIYKTGRQLYLDIMEPDRARGQENRHIKITSIHQGKCIASGIFKQGLTPGE